MFMILCGYYTLNPGGETLRMPVLTRLHIVLLSWGILLGSCLVILGQINREPPGITLHTPGGNIFQSTADSIATDRINHNLMPDVLMEGTGSGGRFRVVQYHPFRLPFDINSVPAEILDTLPGISKRKAGRIVVHRETSGPFKTIEDLRDFLKMSPEKFQPIRPLIQVTH